MVRPSVPLSNCSLYNAANLVILVTCWVVFLCPRLPLWCGNSVGTSEHHGPRGMSRGMIR
jgi:hypothetical protein